MNGRPSGAGKWGDVSGWSASGNKRLRLADWRTLFIVLPRHKTPLFRSKTKTWPDDHEAQINLLPAEKSAGGGRKAEGSRHSVKRLYKPMKCPCPKNPKKGENSVETSGSWKKNLWTLLRQWRRGEFTLWISGGGGLCAFSQSIKLVNAVIAGNLFMWALCGLPLGKIESN